MHYKDAARYNTGVENLRLAIVDRAVKDYKKLLKAEQRLENQKAKIVRKHKDFARSIKMGACSGAQFMQRHEALITERVRLEKKRKINKREVKDMERWFYTDWAELLIGVDGDYTISQIRKIMKGEK